MPSPHFHPRTLPGSAWPPLPTPTASQVWDAYLALDHSQWLDPEQLEQGQLTQLRTLLTHATARVPYYRDLFRERGIRPDDIRTMEDFRRLPLLGRPVYQAEAGRLHAEGLPDGMRDVGTLSTSGTSGVPIDVRQTDRVHLWWLAFLLRDTEWSGVDPRGSLAAIRPIRQPGAFGRRLLEGVAQPTWGDGLHSVIETGRSWVMDIHQDPRRQLAWLRRIDPDYLLSHPTNAEFLAGLALEEGRRLPRLRVIQTISEMLTDASRARVTAAFGVPVRQVYTCTEAGYVASECPEGGGWHVHAENVILEVLDEAGQMCPPGATGRVVLTTLHNFLAPFLRYDIMDEAVVSPARCACGRGLPTLVRVVGKRNIMLQLPGGRAKTSSDLVYGLRKIGGTHQFQIVQRAVDHVVVRVVASAAWTAEHPGRVVAAVRAHFEAPVRVEVARVQRIPPTAGGKVHDVVSELTEGRPPPPRRRPARRSDQVRRPTPRTRQRQA